VLEAAKGVSPQRLAPICSVTKLMVAQVVLDLVRAKKVALSTPIGSLLTYLPEFARGITVGELLTHTSGLRSFDESPLDGRGVENIYFSKSPADRSLRDRILRAVGTALVGPTGKTYLYNNLDFLTLQDLVETLEGRTLEGSLADHVFRKAGLAQARLAPWGDLPRGTTLSFDEKGTPELRFNFGFYGGSGGVLAPLCEVTKWLVSLTRPPVMDPDLFGPPKAFGYQGYGAYAYQSELFGRAEILVERPGAIANYTWQILFLPDRRIAVAAFSNQAGAKLGSAYEGKGLVIDLARALLSP
jgi:CubicO group peptidase (beta-lactamase class C family)